ncbi:hypothetical protein [Methylobacterium aquaticum]|uniref:Uncharacterized protein n=1 Tax=Methylobacterium aquaticum TaxID=270351 RepID=A0A0C6F9S3_9HYPH|nr:hypothetical protein [Methylobacterium aquaticum]BAQ49546.1 hypothetical protein Maq22A_1p36745 [Methylobacterium aquaticum]
MRTILLAAVLLAGAAVPAAAAFTTKLADGAGRTANLRWEPGPTGVRWELVCLDGSDQRRPVEMFRYRGIAPAEDGFVEGHSADPALPGRFVLAMRGMSPFMQIWLDGCPTNGRAVLIRKVP